MTGVQSGWRASAITRFTIVATANLAAAGGSLLFLSLVARTTGPEGLGQMALIVALLLFAQSTSNFGSDSIGIRVVAAKPERAPNLVAVIIAFRLLMCLPIILIVGALLLLTPYLSSSQSLITILTASLVINACTPLWVAQAFERSEIAAIVNAGAPLLSLGLAYALVGLWPRLEMFATTRAVADVMVGTALLAGTVYKIGIGPTPRWADVREIARASNPVGWSKLVINGGLACDLFLVSLFVPVTSLGYYAASVRVYAVGLTMTVLYLSVIMPSLARKARVSPPALRAAAVQSLLLIMPFGVVVAIILALAAPTLLQLAFSPSFASGAPVLQVLCVAALANLASRTCSVSLIVAGHAYVEMRGTLFATLAGLALKACLAATYGIVGGALATLMSELLLLLLQGQSFVQLTRLKAVEASVRD